MKMHFTKKLFYIFFIFIIVLPLYLLFPKKDNKVYYPVNNVVYSSSLTDQLEGVQKELADVQLKKQQIQSAIKNESQKQNQYSKEINTLTNEVNLKNVEIQELQLNIEKVTLEIEILEKSIDVTTEEITVTEKNVEELEEKTSEILTDMYIRQKTFSDIEWVFDPETNADFVKKDLYQRAVQEDTNSDIKLLNEIRVELEVKSNQLVEDKIQVEKDKTLLDEQKITIEKERTILDQKRVSLNKKIQESLSFQQQQQLVYDQSSEEEKKLLAEQELLKQKIFNEVGSVPNGSYVKKGTIIGYEGMTGWATGPHLHFGVAINGQVQNPCNNGILNCPGLSDGSIKWPISPKGVITSGYGQRSYDFHAAIDISTGGSGAIIAAHDGWLIRGRQACYDLTWVKCNGGAANYVIICEDKSNCNNGFKTQYWHLK